MQSAILDSGGTVNGWWAKSGNPNLLMGGILSIITCNNEANELRSSSVHFTCTHTRSCPLLENPLLTQILAKIMFSGPSKIILGQLFVFTIKLMGEI